jgi:heme oxygenase
MAASGADLDGAEPCLRSLLRPATINRADDQRRITRPYGFHVPLEAAAARRPAPSTLPAEDLEAMGLQRPHRALPTCLHPPCRDSAHVRPGALDVVEGSPLSGQDVAQGRRFFTGRGASTAAWQDHLAQVSAVPPEPSARAEVISSAVETFTAFEQWLDGWSSFSHG